MSVSVCSPLKTRASVSVHEVLSNGNGQVTRLEGYKEVVVFCRQPLAQAVAGRNDWCVEEKQSVQVSVQDD